MKEDIAVSYGIVTKIKNYFGYIQVENNIVSFDIEDAQEGIKEGDYVAFKIYDLGTIQVAKSIVILNKQNIE